MLTEVIHSAREQKGLSLRSLAQSVGVDVAYLSRVESGKVPASQSLLKSLSRELPISEDMLLSLGGFLPAAWKEAVEDQASRMGPADGYSCDHLEIHHPW